MKIDENMTWKEKKKLISLYVLNISGCYEFEFLTISTFLFQRMLPWRLYHFLNKDLELFASFLQMVPYLMLHFVNLIRLVVL